MKKLSIGVQTFSKMIREDYLYVDKTREILRLITSGEYFFLSRPRRFGKSLLVSTLKELFTGNQELFKDLFIYDKFDWKPHPVIHLDLSLIPRDTPEILKEGLLNFLKTTAAHHQFELRSHNYHAGFADLILELAKKYHENVVVLIDEYDKPIIDHIENLSVAQKNRDILKYFYEILKGSDQYLRFVFLTGVSKFSRVSVFSGLNNLQDITLSSRFATLLGYTQEELENSFDGYIQQFCEEKNLPREQLLTDIQEWYNGYSWNAKDKVYNPFSILSLFANQRFSNYWFASGTPTFLIQLFKNLKTDITTLEQKRVAEILFDSYDVDRIDLLALLFQSGYLTITDIVKEYGIEYTLDYPNREVKEAFLTYIFESFTTQHKSDAQIAVNNLRRCLHQEDIQGFINIIKAMFAQIPYQLHIQEEAYYHSLFYMIAALMGVEIDLEVLTDKGRIDGVLEFENKVYVIEFKYGKAGSDPDKLTDKAIRQIREKNYAERFLNDPRTCFLLGIGFAGKKIGYKIVTHSE